jgi:hypothetical protein
MFAFIKQNKSDGVHVLDHGHFTDILSALAI